MVDIILRKQYSINKRQNYTNTDDIWIGRLYFKEDSSFLFNVATSPTFGKSRIDDSSIIKKVDKSLRVSERDRERGGQEGFGQAIGLMGVERFRVTSIEKTIW
jgi:hypothetical protein